MIVNPMNDIKTYVNTVLNASVIAAQNFDIVLDTNLFNIIYYAEARDNKLFGFVEENQTEFNINYLGIMYQGLDLNDICTTHMTSSTKELPLLDKGVACQKQPSANKFIMVSKGVTNDPNLPGRMVANAADLMRKLRPS